jgi:hypothetical protein
MTAISSTVLSGGRLAGNAFRPQRFEADEQALGRSDNSSQRVKPL